MDGWREADSAMLGEGLDTSGLTRKKSGFFGTGMGQSNSNINA